MIKEEYKNYKITEFLYIDFEELAGTKQQDKSHMIIYYPFDNVFLEINEGTGDNLFTEDVELGYVDYIYYNIYKSLVDLQENNYCDGGMILLKKLYKDMAREELIHITINNL